MRKILCLVTGLLFISQLVYSAPSTTISVPNPAVANTVIQSSNYNGNNNEISTKYNSHSHTDITSLGTVTTGTWAATPPTTQYGGTGQNFSAATQGGILYFSGTGTLARLVASATNLALVTRGNDLNPEWATPSILLTDLARVGGVLPLSRGGSATTGDSIVKAWGSVTYAVSTPTLNDSYNMDPIADTAEGQITFNFTTDFANDDYSIIATAQTTTSGEKIAEVITKAVGSCLIETVNGSGTKGDPLGIDCIAFGDQ